MSSSIFSHSPATVPPVPYLRRQDRISAVGRYNRNNDRLADWFLYWCRRLTSPNSYTWAPNREYDTPPSLEQTRDGSEKRIAYSSCSTSFMYCINSGENCPTITLLAMQFLYIYRNNLRQLNFFTHRSFGWRKRHFLPCILPRLNRRSSRPQQSLAPYMAASTIAALRAW